MKQKRMLLGALVLGMSVLAAACGNPASQPAQSADTTAESPAATDSTAATESPAAEATAAPSATAAQ